MLVNNRRRYSGALLDDQELSFDPYGSGGGGASGSYEDAGGAGGSVGPSQETGGSSSDWMSTVGGIFNILGKSGILSNLFGGQRPPPAYAPPPSSGPGMGTVLAIGGAAVGAILLVVALKD